MLDSFAVPLLGVSLICACANSAAPTATGGDTAASGPRTDADANARTESRDPGFFIELGTSKLLTADVPYRVRGTELVVISRGAGMGTVFVDGDPNKEDHIFFIALEVAAGGRTERLEATDREPATWGGYRFVADPDGFTWGGNAGAIMVERVR